MKNAFYLFKIYDEITTKVNLTKILKDIKVMANNFIIFNVKNIIFYHQFSYFLSILDFDINFSDLKI